VLGKEDVIVSNRDKVGDVTISQKVGVLDDLSDEVRGDNSGVGFP